MKLRNFYTHYHEWMEKGYPEGSIYSKGLGLCANLSRYADYEIKLLKEKNPLTYKEPEFSYYDVLVEMIDQFTEAGYHKNYPFNGGSRENFKEESKNQALHLNKQRIQWVKDKVRGG